MRHSSKKGIIGCQVERAKGEAALEKFFTQDNLMLLARVLALCVAIPFHELAHAFVSDKLGDHTARDAGRITLNPLKHIDPLGLLSMLVVGVGWAKPVPVNPGYYKNQKTGMAITALAGPASNVLLAFVSLILYKMVWYTSLVIMIRYGQNAIPFWLLVVCLILLFFAEKSKNPCFFQRLYLPLPTD